MLSVGVDIWAGARGRLNAYLGYLLADDADNSTYWQTSTNAEGAGTTHTAPSSLAGYTFTASGESYEINSDGTIAGPFAANVPAITDEGFKARQQFTNLLNSGAAGSTLATQSVTLTAAAHMIAFIGTGTVTLSGAATGSLVGTGANNRVSLAFTPTAGSVTFTVTGDVRYGTLYTGSVAGPIIAGAANSVRGEALLTHNLFADASALTDQGQLIWAKGTPDEISGGQYLLNVSDGTNNNRITLYLSGGKAATYIASGGVGVLNTETVSAVVSAGQEVTLLVLRSGGNWRGGYYMNGTLTWLAAASAGAFPAGMAKAALGNIHAGGAPLRGTLDSAFIKVGTFDTDQKVIDAIAGAP